MNTFELQPGDVIKNTEIDIAWVWVSPGMWLQDFSCRGNQHPQYAIIDNDDESDMEIITNQRYTVYRDGIKVFPIPVPETTKTCRANVSVLTNTIYLWPVEGDVGLPGPPVLEGVYEVTFKRLS